MTPPLGTAEPSPAEVSPFGRPATEPDSPRPWVGLAVGLGLLAAFTWAKLALPDLIGPVTPFLTYFVTVAAAAWLGGNRAGLPIAAAATALAWWLFLDHSRGVLAPDQLLQAIVFAVEVVAISVGTAELHGRRIRRIERESRMGLQRLEVVLQAVDEGITLQDPSGRLIYANDVAARMCGFPSPEALLAADPAELVRRFLVVDEDGAPIPLESRPGRRVLRGEPHASALVGVRPGDGSPVRWWDLRARPILGPDGRVQYAVNVFRDVTEPADGPRRPG